MARVSIPSTYLPMDINVLTGTAITGLLIKLFFSQNISNDGETGPASAAIWGYGVVALSLAGSLIVTFALETLDVMNSGFGQFLRSFFKDSFATILLLITIAWLIMMNVQFFTRINQGKVAPEYNNLSSASGLLIGVQLLLLLKFLHDKDKPRTSVGRGASILAKVGQYFSQMISMLMLLLGTVNVVLVIAMQVVLQFFSTDG